MNDLKAPERGFRPEIEGVRVFAALLVAVYHIWFGKVSGGVDVFFIVSGYLITSSLLSRVTRYDKVNFSEYYLGLMRRLWPLALTVIFFTMVLAYVILPSSMWVGFVPESLASIFYYENWKLAFNSVDYLAQNNGASPFQHFWALSLQGQFYITWPFVILFSYFIARKVFNTPIRKTLLTVLVMMFTISLAYSVYKTEVNQSWAYFDTFARVWEFSLGGILSLLLPYLKLPRVLSFVSGWVGFAVILLTGMILPVSDVFPGYAALLPTTGVILVIISAENTTRFGIRNFLGAKFFLSLGSISYAFYLWHWPIYIFYLAYFDVETVSVPAGLGIILVSFMLSYITSRWIETPIKNLSPKKEKKLILKKVALFLIPVVVISAGWNMHTNQSSSSQKALNNNMDININKISDFDPETYFVNDEEEDVYPDFISVIKDMPYFYGDYSCYTTMKGTGVKTCSYGDVDNPKYTLALVGGSHSGHWFPAIEQSAKELNIQIDLYYKDGCRFIVGNPNGGLSDSCMEWNEEIVDILKEAKPDIIFTTATIAGSIEIPTGYLDMWENFKGISEIVAIRDNPIFPYEIPTCVEQKGIEACHENRDEIMDKGLLTDIEHDLSDHVNLIDFTKYFCDDEQCYSTVNNIFVYRDSNHITEAYSQTLAGPMREELKKIIDKLEVNQ